MPLNGLTDPSVRFLVKVAAVAFSLDKFIAISPPSFIFQLDASFKPAH
jgi:hypothetical protein